MLKALVVDDDDTICLVARRHLTALGFEVMTARNGLEAIRQHDQSGFDLILMDIQMPECDGFEATRRIRGDEIRLNRLHCKIIAMTASQDKDLALESGMDDFLLKPFLKAELLKVLGKNFPNLSPQEA
ncbi:MAG: response regulator [Candidatus Obscuribacterales bacterium]|nr:response regulator [Candidatus Obscuribacterales bacterium]